MHYHPPSPSLLFLLLSLLLPFSSPSLPPSPLSPLPLLLPPSSPPPTPYLPLSPPLSPPLPFLLLSPPHRPPSLSMQTSLTDVEPSRGSMRDRAATLATSSPSRINRNRTENTHNPNMHRSQGERKGVWLSSRALYPSNFRPLNSHCFTVRLKVFGQSSRSYPQISL